MSPPPGRKPGMRGVYAIEDSALVLPHSIALDTSFIVKALVASETGHAACAAFVDRIRELGVTVVTSELVAVEIAETVVKIALEARWGRRWRQHRDDGRTRRRARRPLASTTPTVRPDPLFAATHFNSARGCGGAGSVADDRLRAGVV